MKNLWDLLFHLLGPRLKGNHVKISKKKRTYRLIKIFTLFTHFHNLFTLPIQIRRFSCYYSKSKASEEDVPYETKGFDYGKYALVSQNYSVII